MTLPNPYAMMDGIDELLHAVLGDDVDLTDPVAVEAASDRWEARMTSVSQEERDAIGGVLMPVAESTVRVADGYREVVGAVSTAEPTD